MELCIFLVFKSQQIKNNQLKLNENKTDINSFILCKEKESQWVCYSMDREDEYSPTEFYCPEDLETSNIETETSISESQEIIEADLKNQRQ